MYANFDTLPQQSQATDFYSGFSALLYARIPADNQSYFYKMGVEGWAKVYGLNTITIDDDDDPYAYGFQVI